MNQDATTDEALMQRAADNHRESLELLVKKHATGLMTLIRRMIGHAHQSEEIFQDVVMAVWKNRHQYDRSKPFRPWLYKIAINRCREEFRKTQKVPLSNQEASISLVESSHTPDIVYLTTEDFEVVQQAVERLPQQQRSVVILRVWNGMAYQEIAEAIGVGEATVRTYMHQALKSLRAYLAPHDL